MDKRAGFTLIEIMVVVAIIAILAVVAIPKFGDMVRKSKDAATKGNLGTIRSALSIYAADNEGVKPSDHLESLTANSRYLPDIPTVTVFPYHDRNNAVDSTADYGAAIETQDSGHWLYFADAGFESTGTHNKGDVWVGCSHLDSTGRPWSGH